MNLCTILHFSIQSETKQGVKFSESGAAMEIENVYLSIGNNDIISEINWSIMPKERWALVGRNGAGCMLYCLLPIPSLIPLFILRKINSTEGADGPRW